MKKFYDGALNDTTDSGSDEAFFVNSCGVHEGRVLTVLREKGRKDYHLLYVTDGKCEAEIDGVKYTLNKNDFVLYYPGQKQLYTTDCGCKRYWIHFSGTQVLELLKVYGLDSGVYTASVRQDIENVMDELLREYILPSQLSCTKNAVLLQLLLLRLYESINPKYTNPALTFAVQYMNTQYASQINIDDFARASGLSKDRFVHLFKETTGDPPHKYLTKIRLREAYQMLKYTSLSVSEIAFSAGYDDPLYFSRLFKKYYGVSPKSIRNVK